MRGASLGGVWCTAPDSILTAADGPLRANSLQTLRRPARRKPRPRQPAGGACELLRLLDRHQVRGALHRDEAGALDGAGHRLPLGRRRDRVEFAGDAQNEPGMGG